MSALPADVVVIGGGYSGRRAAIELLDAGITSILVVEKADEAGETWRQDLTDRLRLGREVSACTFDDTTDTWLVSARSGEQFQARTVVAALGPLHVPAVPTIQGREDFGGAVFHVADRNPAFDPDGKRIALIGADAVRALPGLTSASAITILDPFPNLPDKKPERRIVRIGNRLLRRRKPAIPVPPNVKLVTAGIEAITPTGVRTSDGAEHDADAIGYATGYAAGAALGEHLFTGSRGVTLCDAWRDGAEAYLGIAVHGFPNLFLVDGPYAEGDSLPRIVDCLNLMRAAGSTRMEVRHGAQRRFVDRCVGGSLAAAFEVRPRAAMEAEIYDGPAALTVTAGPLPVRARLTGHFDPVDGKYHWQGTLFDTPEDLPIGSVALAIENRCAQGRVTEPTPWGHRVVGVGAPPFGLDDEERSTLMTPLTPTIRAAPSQ